MRPGGHGAGIAGRQRLVEALEEGGGLVEVQLDDGIEGLGADRRPQLLDGVEVEHPSILVRIPGCHPQVRQRPRASASSSMVIGLLT